MTVGTLGFHAAPQRVTRGTGIRVGARGDRRRNRELLLGMRSRQGRRSVSVCVPVGSCEGRDGADYCSPDKKRNRPAPREVGRRSPDRLRLAGASLTHWKERRWPHHLARLAHALVPEHIQGFAGRQAGGTVSESLFWRSPFCLDHGSFSFEFRTTGIKLILLNSDLERDLEHHFFIVNVNIHQKRTDSQSVTPGETFISNYRLAIESHRIRWTETKDVVPTVNDSDPGLHAGNPRVV